MDKKKIAIILIAVIAGFISFSCCCCSALFLIGSNTEPTSESSSETISETTTSTITLTTTSTTETTKATETEPETTAEITTTTIETIAATTPETTEKEDISDSIISILNLTIKTGFPDSDITYQKDTNTYVISISYDGSALLATLAQNDEDSRAEWDKVVDSLEELCKSAKDAVAAFDNDAHISLMLLNDLNKENTLLGIYDGYTIFNCVK